MRAGSFRFSSVVVSTLAVASWACGGDVGANGSAGLDTVIDSTGDTVIARVTGRVAAGSVRHLTEEVRIAPGIDDTTLFTEVREVDVDRRGRMWVYDSPTNSIFLFGPDGELIRRIGRSGGGPGEFRGTGGMVALDSGLAIWDPQNARISFLDDSGDFRTSWLTPTGFFTSDGLVRDRSGTLYLRRPIAPASETEIIGIMGLVRLKDDGAFGDSLAPPVFQVDRTSYVAVSPDKGGRSSTNPRYAARTLWAWHPDGYFVAGNGRTFEILLARTGRKPLLIRREAVAVPVTPEERSEEQESITYSMGRTQPGWSWSGPSLPDTKAPLTSLFIGRDGRIWAQVAQESERIPEVELTPPRDPKQPVNHFRTPVVYEVFSSEGIFLGRVEFGRRMRLMDADGDVVWGITRDADDLPGVARFRVEPAFH